MTERNYINRPIIKPLNGYFFIDTSFTNRLFGNIIRDNCSDPELLRTKLFVYGFRTLGTLETMAASRV